MGGECQAGVGIVGETHVTTAATSASVQLTLLLPLLPLLQARLQLTLLLLLLQARLQLTLLLLLLQASVQVTLLLLLLVLQASVKVTLDHQSHAVRVLSRVTAMSSTGVELEALTSASAAALTVYDMCKADSKDIVISNVQLKQESGGTSGDFTREGLGQGGEAERGGAGAGRRAGGQGKREHVAPEGSPIDYPMVVLNLVFLMCFLLNGAIPAALQGNTLAMAMLLSAWVIYKCVRR